MMAEDFDATTYEPLQIKLQGIFQYPDDKFNIVSSNVHRDILRHFTLK